METLDLDSLVLERGDHSSREEGMCAMEAVAWLAGETHSDSPKCACPVIGSLIIAWNDTIPDEYRTRILKPLLPLIVNTKSTIEVESKRALMALDWLVREYAATRMQMAGFCSRAEVLTSLTPITSYVLAKEARVKIIESGVDNSIKPLERLYASDADAINLAIYACRELCEWVGVGATYVDAARIVGSVAGKDESLPWPSLRPTAIGLRNSCVDLVKRMAATN